MAMHDILVRVGADIGDYTRNLSKATRQLESFGHGVSNLGAAAAKGFGAIATGGIAAIGTTVKVASDFETSFTSVRKTVEATDEQFSVLKKGILDMSKELPASASEIAEVAAVAGQLGIKSDDILKFTRTVMDLGESTNMTAEQAATELARFANITGMSMDNVDRLGATIVDLGNNLATTESEITTMGLRLAGAGTQIGLTESEILAFSGSLSSLGIEAEAGGSAFSRFMLNLQSATMDGGEELKKFAEVAGMSAGDFKQAFEKDAAGAMLSFIEGLGDISDSGGNAAGVLAELGLGEIRVRDALLRASNASDIFSESLSLGTNAWEENSALTEEAAKRYETFASQLAILKNRVVDMLIVIGEPFINALLDIMEAAEPLIQFFEELTEKFANSSESFQQFIALSTIIITILAALGAGLGVIIMIVGQIIAGLAILASALGTTVATLLTVTSVVGIVIAAITAIVAAVIWAYNEFEWFRDMVNTVWEAIKNAVSVAFEFISDIIHTIIGEIVSFSSAQLDKFKAIWDKHSDTIMMLVDNAFDSIKTTIQAGMQFIEGIFQAVWPIISGIVEIAWGVIKTVIGSAIDIVTGLIDAGLSLIQGDWEGAWSAIEGIAVDIMNNIIGFFSDVDLFAIGKDIIQGLIDGVGSMAGAVWDKAASIANGIGDTIKSALNIKSPSRVMRDQVGKMIGQGLIIGMNAEIYAIERMASKLTEAATPVSPEIGKLNLGSSNFTNDNVISSSLRADISERDNQQHSILSAMYNELIDQTAELRRQKQMIVEMDSREVGRAVEPHIKEFSDRNARLRNA